MSKKRKYSRKDSFWEIFDSDSNGEDSGGYDEDDEGDASDEEDDNMDNLHQRQKHKCTKDYRNLIASDSMVVTNANIDAMTEDVVVDNKLTLDVTSTIELKVGANEIQDDEEISYSLHHDSETPLYAEQHSKNTLELNVSDMNKSDSNTTGDYQKDKVKESSDPAESLISTPERRRRVAFEVRLFTGYFHLS